jgi:ethanolamine ammonia-lyase small subunit
MSGAGDRSAPGDPWSALRRFTPARVALGRSGPALPTAEVLAFGLAHARARDAVHHPLDAGRLEAELRAAGHEPVRVRSAAPDRVAYLTRPDLGRRLDDRSAAALAGRGSGPVAIALVVADGLSALAVERHAPPLLAGLRALAPGRWGGLPVAVALQARVALGDEIGERLGARLSVVLIGERPGLSSPDSLGIYLTHGPRVGRTDAERNCISNVRPDGLPCAAAAFRLDWLAGEALRRGLTGVGLKDESGAAHLPGEAGRSPLPGRR